MENITDSKELNTKKLAMDNSYHEAGHTLMAYLFADIFKIEFVTLNLEKSKLNDIESEGGLKSKIIKKYDELSTLENDCIILTLFAGYCADDIFNQTPIIDTIYEPKYWAPKLSKKRYDGDVEKMNNYLISILPKINLEQVPYFSNCMKFLHKFFQKKEVWGAIELISKELSNDENLTLTSEKLTSIIESTEILKWWKQNKMEFFNERMKLLKSCA